MDVTLKTTSFGGYDKKAVENYIDELTAEHEKEVADLKANVLKLSETVKNLHTMREVNLNESSSTIENLKKVNDELQVEVTQLRDKMAAYETREEESASRYESISRTLLEARESAARKDRGGMRQTDTGDKRCLPSDVRGDNRRVPAYARRDGCRLRETRC